MRVEIERILELQSDWASSNIAEMAERGDLVRRQLRSQLQAVVDGLVLALPPSLGDLAVEGRDGTGLKSEIPWTRLYSKARSGSATEGWYLVYLFDAFGDRAALSINQGTTQWDGREFVRRARSELIERSVWAREGLFDDIARRPDLADEISLPARKTNLGTSYEWGNVVSLVYERGSVPSDNDLVADFEYMASLLVALYERSDNSLTIPGEPPPEVLDAITSALEVARRPRPARRFRLNVAERIAIEQRAVTVTRAHLEALGFKTKDVGATESYDVDARRGDERFYVEVKGTVTAGEQVILTHQEVLLHQDKYPNNMLAVVSAIFLDTSGKSPIASGGKLDVFSPWEVLGEQLTPISYTYLLSAERAELAGT